MILPIVAYGNKILREKATEITKDYDGLELLLQNMWETLYNSNGVGLAAPQINKAIRLFLVDSLQIIEGAETDEEKDELKSEKPIKETFINAQILETKGKPWLYNEGCLSIPKVRADVNRDEEVTIKYVDANFEEQTKTFNGITARIILHEYDHIEGKLFIDYLKPLKRKLLNSKLDDIVKGKVNIGYKMIFK